MNKHPYDRYKHPLYVPPHQPLCINLDAFPDVDTWYVDEWCTEDAVRMSCKDKTFNNVISNISEIL